LSKVDGTAEHIRAAAHQQGGAGEMEVGEEHVDGAELEPGGDEQLGRAALVAAYEEAIREGYRFYSYGDAMLAERLFRFST
jgi:hypothetical protein